MRQLQAGVTLEPRAGGGVKLLIKAATGEAFSVELSAEKFEAVGRAYEIARRDLEEAEYHRRAAAEAAAAGDPPPAPADPDPPAPPAPSAGDPPPAPNA